MTLIWLFVWWLSGADDPVVISHLATNPDLNNWAIFLVLAVALDLADHT